MVTVGLYVALLACCTALACMLNSEPTHSLFQALLEQCSLPRLPMLLLQTQALRYVGHRNVHRNSKVSAPAENLDDRQPLYQPLSTITTTQHAVLHSCTAHPRVYNTADVAFTVKMLQMHSVRHASVYCTGL